jgi:hypothetical protein
MTKNAERQETIARINLALKSKDEEKERLTKLLQLEREDFITICEAHLSNQLQALINTAGDPLANFIFCDALNELDKEVHAKPRYKNEKFLKTLLQETMDAFRLAVTLHHRDLYETEKSLKLGKKGNYYAAPAPKFEYVDRERLKINKNKK